MDNLSSTRPYLTRALYDWMEDNALTPYVLVDATNDYVHVPQQYVKDSRIVLNICSTAVRDLFITNDGITFSARFGGTPMDINIPIESVLAIYARENGKGMFFEQSDDVESTPQDMKSTPHMALQNEMSDKDIVKKDIVKKDIVKKDVNKKGDSSKPRPTLKVVK